MEGAWIDYEDYKALAAWLKLKEKEWFNEIFYGGVKKRNGLYKRINTKQQKQQGSNRQRGIPLKDGSEVSKRNGDTALLGIQERSNLLQDAAMRIPSVGTLLSIEGGCLSDKSRSSLRTPIKIKV